MNSNILLYFVKYPTPGKVKTRLAKTVGDEKAAKLYKELAEKNFREIMLLQETKACDVAVVFDPPQQKEGIKKWLKDARQYWPQHEGDLSKRLIGAFKEAFDQGAQKVMVLGSDTLGLTFKVIEQAFDILEADDAVIGPAQDGGYYLIGTKSFYPELFQDIAWSSDEVLKQTNQRIRSLGLRCGTAMTLKDLDEIKDIPILA